jgi:pimeloyl-ACP methyl ester carboxylesterase
MASIYVDAPVCDMKSWPGGKGRSNGSPEDWEKCKAIYGFATEEQAMTYRNNPIDTTMLRPIAESHIPILAVCGDADLVVPMDENILILKKRFLELGGNIEVITKPGVGHHPHSLEDPTPIVNFILNHG